MPTNEERREVAARLRGLYPDDVLPPFAQVRKDIREAIGCGWGQEHRSEKMHKRLAVLIEPEPERTCRIEKWPLGMHADDGYADICSNCRVAIESDFYYCPNCGAKVVE